MYLYAPNRPSEFHPPLSDVDVAIAENLVPASQDASATMTVSRLQVQTLLGEYKVYFKISPLYDGVTSSEKGK